MAKLRYRFTNDTLFKILFVKYPDLLKRLVANILKISAESIAEFAITNPEVPPETVGDKFCRLDVNMLVDGQRVDLEVQISDEGDFPERSLYYWAREYSSALGEGKEYISLPRTIIICIVGFEMFDCAEFHSEFHALEVTRHTPLTDKFAMHYFELPKVPKTLAKDDELKLWLSLFNARTEEELRQIEALEVPVMSQAIVAYRSVTADEKFKELERLRERARHNEASALGNARRKEREKWQGALAEKEAQTTKLIAEKDAQIAKLIAEKDAQIAKLVARLAETELGNPPNTE